MARRSGAVAATTNVLNGLRELQPAADIVELPRVGHYPQVEVPDVFTRAALSLLSMATNPGTV
jgi:pimeloyl-ACP methyl ester carboxylesterase